MIDTTWLLIAKYKGSPIIPVDDVRRDYFGGMSREIFLKKVESGEIPLALTRLGETQKAPKHIHLNDLAAYIDKQADAARKELSRKL